MKFNVIGAGHLGQVLARLLVERAGWQLQDVCNRSLASSAAAIDFIGCGQALASLDDLRPAAVTMLSVVDDQILACCEQLAQGKSIDNGILFHCSGALPSTLMQVARSRNCLLASVHPIRSFADPQQALTRFEGTFCGIEGDAAALAGLQAALDAIGARGVLIDANAKTLYHAAAVFACNYLNTLTDIAFRTWQAAGVPPEQARELAQPLMQQTLDSIFRLGPAQALSGPIARGDRATVERQQAALTAWDPAIGQLYQVLAEHTTELAKRKKPA
jgi:predicted short-subunit dehydrogenase-like oxidoreductase (DUF2520 family)